MKRDNETRPRRPYHTLDVRIPLDRAIIDAGYRTLSQFCRSSGVSISVLGRWRRGKPSHKNLPIVFEMITREGFSLDMKRLMEATGCNEHELFPDVFTDEFYRIMIDGLRDDSGHGHYIDRAVEYNEFFDSIIRIIEHVVGRRNGDIVRMFFGIRTEKPEMTMEEIAKVYGVTRERIRQIIARSLRLLRSKRIAELLLSIAPSDIGIGTVAFTFGRMDVHTPELDWGRHRRRNLR